MSFIVLYCKYCIVQYCLVQTVLYSTVLYSTVLYNTALYSTVVYSTVLYSTVLYSTVLYLTVFTHLAFGVPTWQTIRSHEHNKAWPTWPQYTQTREEQKSYFNLRKKWGATATRDLPQKSFLICDKYTHNSLRSFLIFFTVIHFPLPWVNTPFMHQYIKGVPVLPSCASLLDKGAALAHHYILFITFYWPKIKYFKAKFW